MRKPTLQDMVECATVVSIPLTTPFRSLVYREAMIFDAPSGPAEWSPFGEYDDPEASLWLASTLEQGWQPPPFLPPGPAPARVNGTIPAVPASEVLALITEAGFPHTIKVKVAGPGTTLALDCERVAAVREALGPLGRIRVDANGAWGVDEAEHAIREMEHLDLDYVEQPVGTLADMAEIRSRIRRLGIQVAADESVRRWSDLDAVIDARACDVVILKLQPLGGVSATRRLIGKATDAGLAVVISSALETSVGLHQAALVQAELEASDSFALDAGLDTARFLSSDVVTHPLVAHGGFLDVVRPELDQDALTELRASEERQLWWHARLARCWESL
ncbi:MAG: O-succinylbenzoate synthase [Pontimonas sp.]|jgi:O-succinylbenzoate synthase